MSVPTILTKAEMARAIGLSKQAMQDRYAKGECPPPDYLSTHGDPYWLELTVVTYYGLEPLPPVQR